MKSIFRIYAKTSKGNDSYLYNQLLSFGLKPKHEDLLHSFYFNANFDQIFKLSFESFTAESLYLQLGHKYPLSTTRGQGERSLEQFFKKTNFRNYIPLQRQLIQNITLKILIRESSSHLPSENAIVSILQNSLQKQIVRKQYRLMVKGQEAGRLENYYDIKQLVQKKWEHEDLIKQQQLLLSETGSRKQAELIRSQNQNLSHQSNGKGMSSPEGVFYSPHFVLYIRRNHARMLLKLNKESMHKFGWKKSVGWAPMKQTLTASVLYRTGLIEQFKKNMRINLCDPFCGSGTIALVALSMLAGLKVRTNYRENFIWQNWPIYKEQYLQQFMEQKQKQNRELLINIYLSDLDISAAQSSINNFKQFLQQNRHRLLTDKNEPFLKSKPADNIFEVLPNSIYVGCEDFESALAKLGQKPKHKVNIVTNLPYLGERSKEHHPIKQLNSIYRRFNLMVNKYKQIIDNVFVIVDSNLQNQNHFLKISKLGWRILEKFNNGGLEVCLLGWESNRIGWKEMELHDNSNKAAIRYEGLKTQYLDQYRNEAKQIDNRKYDLPSYLNKYQGLKGARRIRQKRKARQLRATYLIFAKRKDKNQIYEKYARKNLALRLSQRGKTWKRKNISLIDNDLLANEEIIKKQFESRVEQALKKSQKLKERKKPEVAKIKRRW